MCLCFTLSYCSLTVDFIDGERDSGEKNEKGNKSISNQNHGVVVYFPEGVIVKLGPAPTFPNPLVPGPDVLCHNSARRDVTSHR